MELTYKQRLFVEAYLGEANGNGAEAARIAGYRDCRVAPTRLLANASIQAAISRRVASAALTANEVLARISDLASASLGDFLDIDEHGHRVTLLKGKRRGRLHTLKKIKVKSRTFTARGDEGPTTEVETEIELHDPQAALDKLAKYHGLYARDKTAGEAPESATDNDDLDSILRAFGYTRVGPQEEGGP